MTNRQPRLALLASLVCASACSSTPRPQNPGNGGSVAAGAAGAGAGGSGGSNGGSSAAGAAGTNGAGGVTSSGGAGAGSAGTSGSAGAAGVAGGGAGGATAHGGAGGAAGTSAAGSAGQGGGGAGGATGGAGGTSGGAGRGGTGGTYPTSNPIPGLATKYSAYFPIGTAVNSTTYTTHAPLIKAHFNSMTTENEMKWDALEPTENNFTYSGADTLVNFAMQNGMKIRGHTLVWHSQNPSWVFSNGSGGMPTADVLLARMRNHITKVMQHFAGKVYAWDVVNEAIMEDGSYRDGTLSSDKASLWYEIIGPTYIAEAFKAAHAADPKAKLFYNDYYDYIPTKQQAIHDMIQGLLAQGIQVDGIGMQCHINIAPSTDPTNQGYYQDVGHLEDAIKLYSSLGVAVQVTELDMSLYIPGVTYTSSTYYTTATFTDALKNQQADRYAQFFQLFRNYRNVITGVTFWGIADDATWLSMFSSGRQDFPLLFDINHNPKPAFWGVVDF
jgi:endo-1,4-beta-xylanase